MLEKKCLFWRAESLIFYSTFNYFNIIERSIVLVCLDEPNSFDDLHTHMNSTENSLA